MDITTVGGIGVGWILIGIAIALGGVGFGPYFDIPSVIIVIGGTTAVTIGQFEGNDLKRFGKAIKIAFNETDTESTENIIERIIFYTTEIKKYGVIHIEQKVLEETNPFFKEAFRLLVDGIKPEAIIALLEIKMKHIEKRHSVMISIFGNIGGTAGSMGMAGTLIGLVAMLANLSDPSSVGPAMAVALITTMYGALIGTLFAGIMESKLSQKHNIEMTACEIILDGVVMIAQETSIGDIRMRLNAILAETTE